MRQTTATSTSNRCDMVGINMLCRIAEGPIACDTVRAVTQLLIAHRISISHGYIVLHYYLFNVALSPERYMLLYDASAWCTNNP